MIRRPPRSTLTTHSFPTRRSSDLDRAAGPDLRVRDPRLQGRHRPLRVPALGHPGQPRGRRSAARSEEHTSELQSLMRISYAVFCLKKKNKTNTPHTNTYL